MKKKKFNKKILIIFILLISLIVLAISVYNIINYIIDTKNTNNQLETINENVFITEDNNNTEEIIEQEEDVNKNNPYWDYIKMDLIDVDFQELKNTNDDVKGWIQVNGTNINYPFVQTSNNEYYLTHSFDKSKNSSGWVFLDYRNDLSSQNDKNTILYAHAMKNKTMFGTLKNTLNSSWYKNTDNHVIKLSTEYENTLWQVISIYHIETTSDYIKTNFKTDEEFTNFTKMILDRSIYNFNTTVSKNDRILTLSTCYKKTEKLVLHAKLIKRESKN